MGDRRASGHSIIGLAVFEHSTLRAEAVGRCWSRGRLLAWLADSESGPGPLRRSSASAAVSGPRHIGQR
jgi:hypothetical protein